MANQHEGSLAHRIREKFDCAPAEWFDECIDQGLTYIEASKKIGGFTNGTVRKWAKKMDRELMPDQPIKVEAAEYQKKFYSPELNMQNFLSGKWAK